MLVGVSADTSQLLGQLKGDGLVNSLGTSASSILVLSEGCDLRVDSSLCAKLAGSANLGGVALNSLEEQRTSHTAEVTDSLGVGESLISSLLLQTSQVCDLACTLSGSSITQEAEDGIGNLLGVVKVEELLGDSEDKVMRVFLGNLTLADGLDAAGGNLGKTGDAEDG
ncbi:unnamed protein product [Fusarium graminearum]|nr:unnamed protein product [Fusarium graminearum]